jgi:hypothetical protein
MNSYQEDRYSTLLKIDLFIERNSAALSINPGFAAVDGELDGLRAEIFANDVMAERDLRGFTITKKQHRTALENKAFHVSSGLRGYFAELNDRTNLSLIDFPISHFRYATEEKLNTDAEIVWKTADPLQSFLGPNQVTPADISELQTLRTQFVAMMKVNRAEEGASKAARENLVRLFEQAFNGVLFKLDNMMMPFAITNPTLYSEYETARMIDDTGGNSGTEGYNIDEFSLPPGASLTWDIDFSSLQPDRGLYLRAIGGSVNICSTNLPADPCASGFEVVQGVTFKGIFGDLGLDTSKTHIQFTNPGLTTAIVRAGLKEEV